MRYGHYTFATIAAVAASAAVGDVVSSVTLALPGSDIFPVDLFHLRRAWVGGILARSWFAFTHDGTDYVVHYLHNGSEADPTTFVTNDFDGSHPSGLTLHTPILVDLGSSNVTASAVATATAAAINAHADFTDEASPGDAEPATGRHELVITDATNLVVPPATVHTSRAGESGLIDEALRGMWGAQRQEWDGAPTNNVGAAVNETGTVYLGHPTTQVAATGESFDLSGRRVRVLGTYMFGLDGFAPDMAASTGPTAYSATPGALTVVGSGSAVNVAPAGGDPEPAVLALYPAADVGDGSLAHIWAHYYDISNGAPRLYYRNPSLTPPGNGDIPFGSGEALIVNTAAPIGATVTPDGGSAFNIATMIGVIFEVEDDNGNWHADGSLDIKIGDHNDDPLHGGARQFQVQPASLRNEITCHRFLLGEYTGDTVAHTVERAITTIDAVNEDSRFAMYLFVDLAFPAGTLPVLMADAGAMGITGAGHNSYSFTPIDISTTAIGTGQRWIAPTFNYVNETGDLDTYVLPVYRNAATPMDADDVDALSTITGFFNCWIDRRRDWHDDIPAGAGARAPDAGVNEYRSVNAGALVPPQPVANISEAYQDPWPLDVGADSPSVVTGDRLFGSRTGISAVA